MRRTRPDYFLRPDGGYDIYDYRDPGELRIDAKPRRWSPGTSRPGPSAGSWRWRRSCFCAACSSRAFTRAIRRRRHRAGWRGVHLRWFREYLSADCAVARSRARSNPPDRAGFGKTAIRRLASFCRTGFICRGAFNCLPAGGTIRCATITIRSRNQPISSGPHARATPIYRQAHLAAAIRGYFNPVENLTLYGNYGVLLSLGPQGPWWVDNANQFLAPFFTRQAEIGAKYEPGQRILLTTRSFACARRSLSQGDSGAGQLLPANEFNGVQPAIYALNRGPRDARRHRVNAEGKAANWLRLTASAAAIRAISDDTGTPAFDNKQVINVPHLRTRGLLRICTAARARGCT
jgi:iron complex outermembrane recepter protein